jgi:hypothetical protein
LSFDMDAIMGYSREQLEGVLRINEQEIIELLDMNKELLRRIKTLENEIQVYKEHVKSLEEIKVETKASNSVWKVISIASAAVGALFVSLFNKDEK